MNRLSHPSRRAFLSYGTAVAAGSFMIFEGWRPAFANGGNDIDEQLALLASSPDALALRQLLAQALGDPAIGVLAQSTLQNATSLTGFQTSLLQSVLLFTSNTNAVSALRSLLAGGHLSNAESDSLSSLRKQFLQNRAIRKLLFVGQRLRKHKNTDLLQNYVNAAITNNTQTLQTPTTLGDPTLDAVVQDFASVRLSPAFANVTAALVPLMQGPGFVPFLQHQRREVLATFIPSATQIALLLHNDRDPPSLEIIKASLEILGGLAAIIAAILLLPEEITAAVLVGTLFAIFAGFSALAVGEIDLFQAIDCDFDGDPSDPADVAGNECR